ncbi:MAG: tRNA dihydrouridine synthase DusB [Firmicutes bacterium HGW-Firmicutes-9]|nr:MAG: tRNA dihydrouridine synthase DusB [Firmicutes bacterium HGW-Firmicutes-9]
MTKALFPAERPVVCLAPMAGFSDRTFRLLCRERGADLVTSEMISAKGLLFMSDKTRALYLPEEGDAPYAVQLFGSESETLAKAVGIVERDLGELLLSIDLNMGCPAPKIAGNGDGSALMRDPALAGRIVRAVVDAAHVPVSVKFRKGWDAAHENAEEFARICEANGAAFLTIHGRTREQMYSGIADHACMARVKQAVKIPVIANGDVHDAKSALDTLHETGCDGVMIGRGALGNPFVFEEIVCALEGRPYTPPTWDERRETAMRHARMALAEKGDHAIIELRKHLAFYLRGIHDAAKLRTRINTCKTLEELEQIWG